MIKIGDVVVYKPTEEEQKFMADTHNCNIATELPAFVVAVWSESCINIKVMYDGAVDDLWKTSVTEGYSQGQWHKHVADGSIYWDESNNSLRVGGGDSTITFGNTGTFNLDNGIYTTGTVNTEVNELGEPIYKIAAEKMNPDGYFTQNING